MQRRNLDQLLNLEEPGWPLVEEWLNEATNHTEVLTANTPDRTEALLAVQVTTRSPMGAIVYETGGILVDHGWLRILGSGHPKLPRSLPGWNANIGVEIGEAPILIADDVLGGWYALDNGFLGAPQNVFYFAPDTLEWENMEGGYSEFIYWCFTIDLAKYYDGTRWPGWEKDIANLPGDQGFSIVPPLSCEGPPIADRSRRPVPLEALYFLSH